MIQKVFILIIMFNISVLNKVYCNSDSIPLASLPISVGMFESIFSITTDTLSGTAFIYTHNNKQYLITAKHIFKKKINHEDLVFYNLNINNINEPFNGNIYFHNNENVDIAVIKLTNPISKTNLINNDGFAILGSDVFFLGYPLNLKLGTNFNGNKIPLVKKAIFSGSLEFNNCKILILDGFNIEGFSGGPVFALDYKKNKYFLLGMINGYFNNSVNQNSGIIYCHYSGSIDEIINSLKN